MRPSGSLLWLCPALLVPLPAVRNPARQQLADEVSVAIRETEQIGVLHRRTLRSDLEETEQIDDRGRTSARHVLLYEDTWVHGQPYRRLLEDGGIALSGRALRAETDRLIRAARYWQTLMKESNARLTAVPERDFELPLRRGYLTSPAYRLTEQHRETVRDQRCHVVLAEPIAAELNGTPVPQFRYELWINEQEHYIVRLTFELLRGYGTMQKGSHGMLETGLFNGLPVDNRLSVDLLLQRNGVFQQTRTEHTYAHYQFFQGDIYLTPQPAPAEPTSVSDRH